MANGRLKILVFLDNEILIRNFVFGHSFDDLIRRHNVLFVFPSPPWRRIQIDPATLDLGARFVRAEVPIKRVELWNRLFRVDQIRIRLDKGYVARRKLYTSMLGWKATLQFTIYGLPGVFSFFKRSIKHSLAANPCSALSSLIEREKPDLMLHPSTFDGYFINDVIGEGKRNGVPTVMVMNSWDNPSLKCSMSGQADFTVVWGEQTVRHVEKFMRIPREKTCILGAAQFDIFKAPPRLSREGFCREHGIDPARTVVMYAGSSRQTDEYAHLRLLDDAIERGLIGPTTVVYRPHPWGRCGVKGERIANHPWRHVVVENSMRDYVDGVAKGKVGGFLDNADYYRAHDVLSSIDALISPLSTIILEAILHGKPTLCFLPIEEGQVSITCRRGLDHFVELFRSQAMVVCYSIHKLIDGVRILIDRSKDPSFAALAKKEATFFVKQPDEPYSVALANLIEDICKSSVGNRFEPIIKRVDSTSSVRFL